MEENLKIGAKKNKKSKIEEVQKMYERNMELELKTPKHIIKNAKQFADDPEKNTRKKRYDFYEKTNEAISTAFPIAGANLQDSLYDFEHAKKNPHAYVLNSRKEVKNEDINKVLNEANVPKNSKGVFYDINSKQSKAIFDAIKAQKLIKEKKEIWNKAEKGYHEELEFKGFRNIDSNIGLQHCKILNPKITPDNYFEATIIDYWDFNNRNFEKLKNLFDFETMTKNIKTDGNNWGKYKQDKKELENFFVIYSIREKMK